MKNNRRSCRLPLLLVLASLALALAASAQIQVGLSGVTNDFTSQPPATSWSTKSLPGTGTPPESDAAVDQFVNGSTNAASTINAQVNNVAGDPPGSLATAQWTSSGYLITRPTGNAVTLLMATLTNVTGGAINSFTVKYDYTQKSSPVPPVANEVVKGHRVYYNLNGATNQWVPLGDYGNSFSTNVVQAISIALDLSATPWASSTVMYLLFADDNSNANSDGANAIDNFRVTNVVAVLTPVITVQPQNTSVAPGGNASFTVGANGGPPFTYYWRKDGSVVSVTASSSYSINNAVAGDAGTFSVIVSNAYGTATSTDAVLTVGCFTGVAVTTPPQNQSLQTGGTVALSVAASGTQPFRFQWQRDGQVIPNATNQNYSQANALTSDSGAYRVIISNCLSAVTSSVATVAVTDPPYLLIGLTNQFWKYDQSGADLGTAWREIAFDDSAWSSGRGVLARETDNALTISLTNTVLSLTGTNGQGNTTYYFRTHFTLTNDPQSVVLVSSNLIDDGAVAYLNGVEVFRSNMPSTPITATTTAVGASTEGVFVTTNLPAGTHQLGDNVLALEVHQVSPTSSDIVFGMAVLAEFIPPAPPIINTQPTDLTLSPGQDAVLSVSVTSGTTVSYQWFQNGTALPFATNRVLLQTNASFAQGGLYSVASSNASGVTTSRVATVNMIGGVARLRLLEFTNLWRFNISASNLGTAWRGPAYDDSSWPGGQGVFWKSSQPGYPEPTNTTLPLISSSGNVITTYYFRVHFTLPPGLSNVILVASNLLDDGAVFHLNGSEVGRIRLTGNVTYDTFAAIAGSDGRGYEALYFSPANLVAGDNALAVELHQSSANSSDAVFGMNLRAYGAFNERVTILTPLASQVVGEGSPATFFADVFGGQPVSYQWFRNGGPLAGATNATIQIAALHAATTGNYFFIASNNFSAVTSSVAALNMIADTTAPTLTAAYTTNGQAGVLVFFSEPITLQSATNLANYAVTPGVSILSAQQIAPNAVLLTVANLDVQMDYTVTVTGILDQADSPNGIAPGNSTRVRPNRQPAATGLLQVQTVFIILMENIAWLDVKGNTSLPYLNGLLPLASYCDNYFAHNNTHPSAPNYIWLEAGDNFGHDDDSGPAIDRVSSTNHLATQLFNAGIEWRGYMEDMAYGSVGVTNGLPYLARHNPFAFFDDVTTNYDYCTNHVRPYAEFAGDLAAGRIGRYNFITPNYTNDMHSFAPGITNRAKQGDDWLARELPQILNSSAFSNNGAVFITWDENDYSTNNAIGMIVLSPLAKGGGYASGVFYDHSSTLRTMQEIFQVRPLLGDAANVSPLNDLFKDLSLRIAPSNGVAGVWLENVLPGRTNYVQSSSDLIQWTTIQTNTATNRVFIADPPAGPYRFYRAVEIR